MSIPTWSRWLAGPLLLLAVLVTLAPGCGSGSDAPAEEETPRFNGVDESLVCPAGEIGWDFATGGSNLATAQGTSLSGIQVVSATYGKNCLGGSLLGNATHDATAKCNGEYKCDFTPGFSYDPAFGCAKNFEAQWRCGAESTVYSTSITGEAGGKKATLDCGPRIHVVSARYGPAVVTAETASRCGSQPPAGSHTNHVKAQCEDTRGCDFKVDNVPKYSIDACKTYEIYYQCAGSPRIYTATRPVISIGETIPLKCDASPLIHIVDATYGANCGSTTNSWLGNGLPTDRLKTRCDLRTSCDYKIEDLGDPFYGCRKAFAARYTCGEAPFEYTAGSPGEAGGTTLNISCVGASAFKPPPRSIGVSRKVCVPRTCPGNQKRGANMECLEDPTKQFITAAAVATINVLDAKGTEITRDYANAGSGPELFGSTPLLGNTPYRIAMELDMRAPTPVHPRVVPWLATTFATADYKDQEVGFLCSLTPIDFDHTAAIRVTQRVLSPATYNILPPSCLDGRSNSAADAAKRRNMKEADFRAKFPISLGTHMHVSLDPEDQFTFLRGVYDVGTAPNPPGFFYNRTLDYTDLVSFYRQRELDTSVRSSTTPIKFHPAPPPSINLAISDWKVTNGATQTVEFFPVPNQPQTANVDINYTMTGDWPANPLSPSSTQTAITNLRTRKLRATVEVFPYNDEANPIVVASVPLLDGNPTNTSRSVSFSWDLLRQKIFGGWGGVLSLDMKVCIDVDGTNTRTGGISTVTGGNGFSAKIDGNCRKKTNALVFTRSITKRPLPPDSPVSDVGNTKSNTSGDAKTSGTNSSGLDKTCTESGAGATLTQRCSTTRTSGMTASGELQKTYYSSQSGTQRLETAQAVTASSSMVVEVLGFQVVNVGDDADTMTWGKGGSVFTGSAPVKISIAPNWDLVVQGVKKAAPPTDPKKAFYGGRAGIGIGIGAKMPFFIGVVDINATVGVSVSLDFTLAFQPDSPYACINGNNQKCFAVLPGLQTQADARRSCMVKGGRLAQMVTAADRSGIQAAATANQSYWTGGQLAYTYNNVACANDPYTAACKDGSSTSYRWLGTDTTFATSSGQGGAVTLTANTTATTGENGLSTRVPVDSGVLFNGSTKVLSTNTQSTRAQPICEFDAANSAGYSSWSVALNFGAGAGVGIGFCTPTPDVGVCIAGQLNLVDVSLAPTVGHTAFTLRRADGTRFGTRGNTYVDIPWSISLLTGQVVLTANFLFTSTSWTLAEFEGFKVAGGSLFRSDSPTREDF